MKISVSLQASPTLDIHKFDLEDLNVTQEAWEQMSDSEKIEIVQKAVNELPEHPYWVVASFYEL